MRKRLSALVLLATSAGCGGGPTGSGDFLESLARLLSARFVPASVTVLRGTTRPVDLEVVCDRAALNTPFGRLGIRVRLDPDHRLPEGVAATVSGSPDRSGFVLFQCTGAHADPSLAVAHVAVQVQAAPGARPTAVTLVGEVEVEPLTSAAASKDSTRAELAITVPAGEGTASTS